jgi:hypothetical protein
MGRRIIAEHTTRHTWSSDQIVDVAALFKYIDLKTGNWLWLDFMASFPYPTNERVLVATTAIPTAPIYGIKKSELWLLLRKSIANEYLELFQNEVLYFRVHDAIRVVFDTARRLYKSTSYTEAVMLIINDRISRLQSYDYLDASEAKVELLKKDSSDLLERIGGEALANVPRMKNWLEDDNGQTKVRVLVSSSRDVIEVTVKANVRLLEATIFEVFLFECIASQNVPKRDRLIRVGRLFTDTSDDTFRPDTVITKIISATHKTGMYANTVYDAFHVCCCDYVAFHQSVPFADVKKSSYDAAADRLTSFIRLYTVMSQYYDVDTIADIMKSVCLCVTTPAIAHALYTVMTTAIISDSIGGDHPGSDRRMIVLSSLLDACRGLESSLSWVEERYRTTLQCALPHTISDSDTIYPVSILERLQKEYTR